LSTTANTGLRKLNSDKLMFGYFKIGSPSISLTILNTFGYL
jgi:hypothetical protein